MKKNILLLFFLLLTATCQAADISQLPALARGNQYFAEKDYQKAYDAYYEAFLSNPTSLDLSFFMGRAAFENGDYETAIMSFERILIMQPESIRIKLELARCYMGLQAYEMAKQYFYEVLATNPPEQVQANIQLYLAAIAATEKKHFFYGTASFGISLDDNIRTSPGTIYDALVEREKDSLFTTSLSFSHVYIFEDSPFAWKSTATNFNNSYWARASRDLDIVFYGLSTGPTYQTDKMLLEANAYVNKLDMDYEDYLLPIGASASATFVLDPKVMVTLSAGVESKDYAQEEDYAKDALNWNITASQILTIDSNRITFTIKNERENADQDFWSYDRVQFDLKYEYICSADLSVFTMLEVENTNYDSRDPDYVAFFTNDSPRSDNVRDLGIGLNKLLWQSKSGKFLTLQLSHTYTVSDSNNLIYRYHKNVSASLLSFSF